MHTATKSIDIFLASVLEYESKRSVRTIAKKEIALRICEKLRLHLHQIFGNSGYHALISRAVAVLNKNQAHQWVEQLVIAKNGTISLADPDEQARPADGSGNPMDLPAQLLVTLATLIGETLTLNLAREVWPMVGEEPPPAKHLPFKTPQSI